MARTAGNQIIENTVMMARAALAAGRHLTCSTGHHHALTEISPRLPRRARGAGQGMPSQVRISSMVLACRK